MARFHVGQKVVLLPSGQAQVVASVGTKWVTLEADCRMRYSVTTGDFEKYGGRRIVLPAEYDRMAARAELTRVASDLRQQVFHIEQLGSADRMREVSQLLKGFAQQIASTDTREVIHG